MGIISWLVLGLIAGLLAKWIMPGEDPGGMWLTITIGIVGAFVGGFIGSFLGIGSVDSLSISSIFTAVGGALLLLFVFRGVQN